MLFFATIINSMGMFVFPFLTLYLTGRLGMSQEKAGFFIMMLYLVYGPASLIGGKLADSFGRKKLMVIAQVLSGLCYIPCGFPTVGSNIRWFLLASVFFDGLTDPARSAWQDFRHFFLFWVELVGPSVHLSLALSPTILD